MERGGLLGIQRKKKKSITFVTYIYFKTPSLLLWVLLPESSLECPFSKWRLKEDGRRESKGKKGFRSVS